MKKSLLMSKNLQNILPRSMVRLSASLMEDSIGVLEFGPETCPLEQETDKDRSFSHLSIRKALISRLAGARRHVLLKHYGPSHSVTNTRALESTAQQQQHHTTNQPTTQPTSNNRQPTNETRTNTTHTHISTHSNKCRNYCVSGIRLTWSNTIGLVTYFDGFCFPKLFEDDQIPS